MGKWTEKVSENASCLELTKPSKPPFVSFGSTDQEHIRKNHTAENAEPETIKYHGFSLADLEAEAHPDEWQEVRDNPEVLRVFALSLLEGRQMAACVTPERFTKLARCQGCGAVHVPDSWPTERVEHELGLYAKQTWQECPSCPWCRLRNQGKAYPKPCPTDNEGKHWPRPISWQGADERPRKQPEGSE